MRRSRQLPAGLALLVAASAAGYALVENARPQPALNVRYTYLLVSVEASPEWIEQQRPAIVWSGAETRLPVVFRSRMSGNCGPHWGAVAEEARYALTLGGVEVPVRVTTPGSCRVSNEPAFGVIPERGRRSGETAISVATWVTVGPPDRPSITPGEAQRHPPAVELFSLLQREGVEGHRPGSDLAGEQREYGEGVHWVDWGRRAG